MSVRDLIWVNTAQAIRVRRSGKQEVDLLSTKMKTMEMLYLAICDCRELSMDSNFYMRFSALKGSKVKRVKPFDEKNLPSNYVEEERKEAERRSKMTPEQLADEEFRDFMAGKTIRRH